MSGEFGVVVIGRNEGERLKRCLASVLRTTRLVVYVDSGSIDESAAHARTLGVAVVELDKSVPFTAARARNAGFKRLCEGPSQVEYVQFIDGDCELTADWPTKAARWLNARADVAIVCGRLRERNPERTIYNLLCDIEWDAPVGEANACGGVAMARMKALAVTGGYRADLIAGEEPELCVRLRARGWKIWRLQDEMALHDAAITRFGQWWRRNVRAGYAFAQGAFLHGGTAECYCLRESCRAWIWAGLIPLCILAGSNTWGAWGLLLIAVYPLQILRLSLRGKRQFRDNLLASMFLVLGKFAEMTGQIKFLSFAVNGKKAQLIEYK